VISLSPLSLHLGSGNHADGLVERRARGVMNGFEDYRSKLIAIAERIALEGAARLLSETEKELDSI